MPKFIYKARKGPQQLIDGFVDAINMERAVAQILQMGLTPVDVMPSEDVVSLGAKKNSLKASLWMPFKKRVGPREIVPFFRQMSDLSGASVPLLRSLEIVGRQTNHPAFKSMIEGVRASVEDGGSLSDGLMKYPGVFRNFYTSMVRTAEVSGQLPEVLSRLAEYLEKEQETQGRIKNSLAYPIFVLLIGVLTVFVLLTFVIPKLVLMYEDMDQALPLPTIILMSVSYFLAKFGWIMIVVSGFLFWQLKKWLNTPYGQWRKDFLLLKIPFFWNFILNVEIGRFSRSLGTLIATGVSMITALKAVEDTIQNTILRQEIRELIQKVSDGGSLRLGLKETVFFPEYAINMIAVAEETGKLDQSLFKIADIFERQADQTSRWMVSILGPLMLVGIVIVIGFVVVALLLPILQMNLIVE
jgi:type II secretory pathway component PulF